MEIRNNAVTPQSRANWLFFSYIGGDNNLAEDQLNNIDQMEQIGSDEDTHIVAYMDVGPNPNPLDRKWSGMKGFYINKDNDPRAINSKIIADYGDKVDSSAPETLENAGTEVLRNFDATYRAIIFNNHGGGFTGAISDDSDGYFMSIPEQRQTLEKIKLNTGKGFDIIGYDCCLMGMLEVAYELKDLGDIMLGSEENEMGAGWKYDSMLGARTMGKTLKILKSLSSQKINVNPEVFGSIVVDVNKQYNYNIPTFAALKLKKIKEEAKNIINEFADAIINTKDINSLREAISKSEHYAPPGAVPYNDYHDLHHMCNLIKATTTDENLRKAAEKTAKWVEETAYAYENDPGQHPNSRGISIYAPLSINGDIGYKYKDLAFYRETNWGEAIKKFAANKGGSPEDTPRRWPDGSLVKPNKRKSTHSVNSIRLLV